MCCVYRAEIFRVTHDSLQSLGCDLQTPRMRRTGKVRQYRRGRSAGRVWVKPSQLDSQSRGPGLMQYRAILRSTLLPSSRADRYVSNAVSPSCPTWSSPGGAARRTQPRYTVPWLHCAFTGGWSPEKPPLTHRDARTTPQRTRFRDVQHARIMVTV